MDKLVTIGYLQIDIDKYISWYKASGFDWLRGMWLNVFYKLQDSELSKFVSTTNLYDTFSDRVTYDCDTEGQFVKRLRERFERYTKYSDLLVEYVDYCHSYNQRISIVYEHELFYVVKLGKDFQMVVKLPEVTGIENLTDVQSLISLPENISEDLPSVISQLPEVSDNIQQVSHNIELLNKEAETINDGTHDKLSSLMAELKRVENTLAKEKEKLMMELEEKRAALDKEKTELELKLEKLEAQIYSIRCYTGEVIDFVQLRDGARCSVDEPIIVYQKFRYMDVELGKLFSSEEYYDETDTKFIEELLKNNRYVFDAFCPNTKGISIIKISQDGKVYGHHPFIYNILQSYELYHGDMLGILIRDGESLFIGWTDEDKISFSDKLFYSSNAHQDLLEVDDEQVTRSTSKEEMLSRYYLFNILEGCLNYEGSSRIINLPSGSSFIHPCDYIVYSSADGWIESNTYPTLNRIKDKVNDLTKEGDMVISLEHLFTGAENEYRGRGDTYNRARGTYVSDCTIYRINLKEITSRKTYYNSGDSRFVQSFSNLSDEEIQIRMEGLVADNTGLEWRDHKIIDHYSYYVSILKDDSKYVYDGDYHERVRDSRANVEIYPDEFINIQLLNSDWIKYWLDSENIGNLRVGGKYINFSYIVRYLNKMLKHVVEREVEELHLLVDSGLDEADFPDWRVKLSEYKMTTGRHILKPRWAKQFVKQLQSL